MGKEWRTNHYVWAIYGDGPASVGRKGSRGAHSDPETRSMQHGRIHIGFPDSESGGQPTTHSNVLAGAQHSEIMKKVGRDDKATLDGLIDLVIHLDNVMLDRRTRLWPISCAKPSNPEPMQINGTHLAGKAEKTLRTSLLLLWWGGSRCFTMSRAQHTAAWS